MTKKVSGLAIASFVLGIIGLLCILVPILFAQIFGIFAVAIGFIALDKIYNSKDLAGKELAIAGIITGFIAFFLIFILAFFGVVTPTPLVVTP